MTTFPSNQLTIYELLEEIQKHEEAKEPYRNGLGELLPWEEDEISIRMEKRIDKGGE